MTIGEKIRFYRKKKSLSQKKLGELARISETSIKKYESGDRNPKFEQILKLASVLDVKIDDFVGLPKKDSEDDDSVNNSIHTVEEVAKILGSDMEYTITKDETDSIVDVNIQFKLTKECADEMIATTFENANDHASFEKALIGLLCFEFENEPMEERVRIYESMMKIIDEKFKK